MKKRTFFIVRTFFDFAPFRVAIKNCTKEIILDIF